jgi:hypothetical protein
MREDIFYVDAKTKIVDFLASEFDDFPIKLQNRFLNFFPQIVNYEEESMKYKPAIMFTNNIDAIIKAMPNPSKLEFFADENEHMFASRLKSIVPFCRFDWSIYINVAQGAITYGIFKNFNSIKEEGLEELIFSSQSLQEKSDKVFGIYVRPESSFTVKMKSLRGRAINVNFALDIKTVNDWSDEIHEFVEASFSKLKTTAKKLNEVKTLYKNIFKNVLRNINGTICVVVDKDYNRGVNADGERDDLFADGIWLKEPIQLSKLFLSTHHYHEEKLTAMANVFFTMLNFDGITVVDNTGCILAYNVFVEANLRTAGNIIGGARKRAAYTIINSRKRGIVGLYFQSQDGEMFWAPMKK